MSTTGNFFENMARRASEVGQAGLERARAAIGGLRGAQAQPQPSVQNPNVDPGTGSAEARAFRASGAGNPPHPGFRSSVPVSAAEESLPFLKNAMVKVGRLAGPAAGAVEAYGAAKNIAAGESPLRSTGRAALRGGLAMLGGAGGATLGTAVAPGVGTAAGGVAGGTLGYEAGDYLAGKIFGPEPKSGAEAAESRPQPAPPPAVAASQPTAPQEGLRASARPSGDYVDLTDGNRARPSVLTDTNLPVVPARGQGAFRRTTRGNEGAAQVLRSDDSAASADQPLPGVAGRQGMDPAPSVTADGLRAVPAVAGRGLYGFKSQAINARNTLEARGQDITRESAQYDRAIRLATLQHTLRNENEERFGKQAEAHVRAKLDALQSGTIRNADKGAYDANVAKETAAFKNRVQYSLADSGKGDMRDLKPEQFQQLRELDKIRDRVEDSRQNAFQTLRDLIGQKRFDSENLYSYAVARDKEGRVEPAVPSAQGGYVVKLGNGNTIHVADAVSPDGRGLVVLFGTNKPVDADTMSMIRPAIEAAKRRGR